MDSNGKYTIDEMVAAAHDSYGLIAKMATALGCERQTVYNYAKKYKTVEAAIEQARHGIVDIAEVALLKKITSGDTASIVFVLKTLGKNRGYVERNEITGKDGEEILVKVVYEDADGQT